MNHENTFHIICTFLQPKEINKFRYLSKTHHLWTEKYIEDITKINESFVDQICPKCSNWIYNRDIADLTHFWDIYGEDNKIIELYRIKRVRQFLGVNTKRSFLFCEDCESEEVYDLDTNFPFKGNRVYQTLTMNDISMWCIIFTEDRKKWNEYRCPNIEFIYNDYDVYENEL